MKMKMKWKRKPREAAKASIPEPVGSKPTEAQPTELEVAEEKPVDLQHASLAEGEESSEQ